MKNYILPFEKPLKKIADKWFPKEIRARTSKLLSNFTSVYKHGPVSTPVSMVKSVIQFLDDLDQEYSSYHYINVKLKDELNDEFTHLNSQDTFLDEKSQKILNTLRICVFQLLKGSLYKQVSEIEYDYSKTIYSYYKYDMGEVQVCLVKKDSERGGTTWMSHFFSSEADLDVLIEKFREWFWAHCENSVYFTKMVVADTWQVVPVIQESLKEVDEYIGKFGPEELYEYWQSFAEAGISRSLLFVGPPGTGKTSTVRGIANIYNLKLAKVDPSLLQAGLLDEKYFSIWYEIFAPSLVLFDDVHGIQRDSGLSDMLSMLEYINKRIDTRTLVIGTANKLKNVDVALRRPGRFDASFVYNSKKFEEPIIKHYAEKYGVLDLIDKKRMDFLVKQAKKLTPAYMKEVIRSLRALNGKMGEKELWEFIEERIKLMVALAKDSEKADEVAQGGEEKESVGFRPKGKNPVEFIANKAGFKK